MTVAAASLLADVDARQRGRTVGEAVGGVPVTTRLASLSFASSGGESNGDELAPEDECPPGWTLVESKDGARRYWNKLTGEISAVQPSWSGPEFSPCTRRRTGTAPRVSWPAQSSSLGAVPEDEDEEDDLASPSF